MYHVMIKENEAIVCEDQDINENKKNGYQLYSGSSSIKNANEMAERLREKNKERD
ncbi:hypothetical protein [Aneurinibacillus tyrosinisolvens]|uniref:hypothetical protein n=1 Tax=Aneurinibacillus tyrosinisolvens TaxID=1443435 RepID=UPI000A69DAC3|nr:hypothetical protein [Aneurinibacillus tyrosinisolvens]